jgi:hypothetical protein
MLFLAGSTSFDPKAVISHMFIPKLGRPYDEPTCGAGKLKT